MNQVWEREASQVPCTQPLLVLVYVKCFRESGDQMRLLHIHVYSNDLSGALVAPAYTLSTQKQEVKKRS